MQPEHIYETININKYLGTLYDRENSMKSFMQH